MFYYSDRVLCFGPSQLQNLILLPMPSGIDEITGRKMRKGERDRFISASASH
jgi:hypothetical protein